jgi:hypothetical protein
MCSSSFEIEAEAGLDADGEQVERVGQRRLDVVAPLPAAAADHEAGCDVADRHEPEHEDEPDGAAGRGPEQEPDEEAGSCEQALRRDVARGRHRAEPGGEQTLLDLLEALAPVHAQHEPGDARNHGRDCPLSQREPLLAGGCNTHAAVARGAANERAAFALRLRRDVAEHVGGAGKAGGSD